MYTYCVKMPLGITNFLLITVCTNILQEVHTSERTVLVLRPIWQESWICANFEKLDQNADEWKVILGCTIMHRRHMESDEYMPYTVYVMYRNEYILCNNKLTTISYPVLVFILCSTLRNLIKSHIICIKFKKYRYNVFPCMYKTINIVYNTLYTGKNFWLGNGYMECIGIYQCNVIGLNFHCRKVKGHNQSSAQET